MTLQELTDLFKNYFHLPDPAPLRIVLAVIVANRIANGRNVWLLLVGPPSSGKTSLFDVFKNEPDVVSISTTTEAGLLSRAGGALRKVEPRGTLCFKDFGSMLANPASRATLLAALREIYDGQWIRFVHPEPLIFHGHCGLLGAVTEAIDEHVEEMAQLGERFLYYRFPRHDDQDRLTLGAAAAQMSLIKPAEWKSLEKVAHRFLAGLTLPSGPVALADDDQQIMTVLCDLVTRCRTPVRRNAKDQVTYVPEPEEIPRIQGMLTALLQALRIIGVEEWEQWRLLYLVALSSMSKTRRQILDRFIDESSTRVNQHVMAEQIGLSLSTVVELVTDLVALKVLERKGDFVTASSWLKQTLGELEIETFVRR
jgi:hypothetical protein